MITSAVAGDQGKTPAVLWLDIDDQSRLSGIVKKGTHERVDRNRREIIALAVAQHYGHPIDNADEGFLAIFDRPLEAVRCALTIQQNLARRSALLPKEWRMQFRAGIGLCDISGAPDDIRREGWGFARQVQSLAGPGTLCISGDVYERVKNRLGCRFQWLGVVDLPEAVDIYRVLPNSSPSARPARLSWLAYGIATAIGLAGGGLAGWYKPPANVVARAEKPPVATIPVPAEPLPGQTTTAVAFPLPNQTEQRVAAAEQALAPVAVVLPPRLPPPPPAAPYQVFRECDQCPEMVDLPGGNFAMGSNEDPTEQPVARVTVPPFALGRGVVTVGEWKRCVAANACKYEPEGQDDLPVHNISWNDAQQYVAWLSQVAGAQYRLPTEAEWEYAARAGTSTRYWWGNQLVAGMANCKGCEESPDPHQPMKAGSFAPNPFGLYDMAGGVTQWMADCWHKNYRGAPDDGSAWDAPNCRERVLRGGSWMNGPNYSRASCRDRYDAGVRYPTHGLRIALSRSR